MITQSTLKRPQHVVVLNAVTGKNVYAAVIHPCRHTDNQGSIGPAQSNRQIGIKIEFGRGLIELLHSHVAGRVAPFECGHTTSWCALSRVKFLSRRPTHLSAAK